VTRAIADNFATLQKRVLPAYMPVLTDARASRNDLVVEVVELGCGAYGCVLPTDDPGVVLKVTTDATEFELVSKILPEVGGAPEGLARYFAWAELEGKVKLSRGGDEHNAFALWRESASDIGDLEEIIVKTSRTQEGDERLRTLRSFHLLVEQQQAATEAYVMLARAPNPDRLYMEAIHHHDIAVDRPLSSSSLPGSLVHAEPPARALALLINYFRACVAEIAASGALGLVGRALEHLFERGILVADVHTENVGRVKRGADRPWVITDPGNVAVLPQPWPIARAGRP
jgi:hypothetical protein